MPEELDGLISFFASHHAIRAETVLKRAGCAAQLVPGPKELSPNCGVALRFEYARRDTVLGLLAEKRVQIDAVHFYRPRTDEWFERRNRSGPHPPTPSPVVCSSTTGEGGVGLVTKRRSPLSRSRSLRTGRPEGGPGVRAD